MSSTNMSLKKNQAIAVFGTGMNLLRIEFTGNGTVRTLSREFPSLIEQGNDLKVNIFGGSSVVVPAGITITKLVVLSPTFNPDEFVLTVLWEHDVNIHVPFDDILYIDELGITLL